MQLEDESTLRTVQDSCDVGEDLRDMREGKEGAGGRRGWVRLLDGLLDNLGPLSYPGLVRCMSGSVLCHLSRVEC